MSTRLKKPSIFRQAAVAAVLISFQIYLAHSLINGQFGLRGQEMLRTEISELEAETARLGLQIDAFKHNISLFAPQNLDPDILTELARSELSMAHPDEILVHLD